MYLLLIQDYPNRILFADTRLSAQDTFADTRLSAQDTFVDARLSAQDTFCCEAAQTSCDRFSLPLSGAQGTKNDREAVLWKGVLP